MKGIPKMPEMPESKPITIDANTLADALSKAVVAGMEAYKKPDEDTAKKQAEDKARMLKNQQQSIAEQMSIKQQITDYQSACQHQKGGVYAGQHTMTGIIHGDGLFHPVCFRCSKEFPPFPPGPKTIPPSETVGSDNMKYLNPRTVEKWGKEYQESLKAVHA